MPEGDTIHKIANFLAPRLVGKVVRGITVAERFAARKITAGTIAAVTARGKHLYIGFDDGGALRSHLGMYGSWHFYGHGEAWRKPARQASLVLKTDDTVYVCFNARDIEWVRMPGVRERVLETRLGPDLTTGDVAAETVVRRAREFAEPDDLLADVLLDQRVACGIGNVYKSELLFIRRHHPRTELATTGDDELAACYRLPPELLGSNLGGGKRVTRREADHAGRLWVYGRGGSPCLRCDGTISFARIGRHQRGTYWCEGCQSSTGA